MNKVFVLAVIIDVKVVFEERFAVSHGGGEDVSPLTLYVDGSLF